MSRRSWGRRWRNCRSWLWSDGNGSEPFGADCICNVWNRIAQALCGLVLIRKKEKKSFEEGPHGLALSDQSSAESLSQVYPDAAKWADLAGEWLKKRFALPLEEKSSFEKLLENGGI